MEVRNRKRKWTVVLLLLILCSFGFAFTAIYEWSRVPDTETPAPDTIVKPRPPLSDSIYRNHLYGAEKLIQQKKYNEALDELGKALVLRPNDAALKTRITQVKAMAAQQQKDQEEYKQLILSADKYFSAKDYLNAKATYQLALNLVPGDAYASGRLNETMGFLRSQKAQNILYDVAVANADKFFEAGELDKAKAEYEKAAQILPSDQYAKDRVNEIIKIQVDKQVREELYTQAITRADQFYNVKKYQGALTEYKNALKQKPNEKYPQDRVKELTEILNQLKALDEAYQKAIASADQLFVAKRYPDARTGYQDALKIKPAEAYPKNRIREIDAILTGLQRTSEEYERYITLADSFYIDKNFVLARQNYQLALQLKPNEAYPKEMLSKTESGVSTLEQTQKALEEAYAAAIAAADKLFGGKSWEAARKEYNGALMLKPGEAYPKSKIAEIDKTLEALAQQRSLEDQYSLAVAEADKLFGEKSWPEAKAKYQAASGIKPGEQYPKTKIAEIDGILAGLAKQKAAEDQYASLIAKGDQSFAAKAWDAALASYNQALALKPDEQYPKDRISEIGGITADLAKQKQLDDQYAGLIAGADKLFAAKTWEAARKGYTDALGIKPGEKYPQEQIGKIDIQLGEVAKQKAIDEQYTGVIAVADQLFAEKKYEEAKPKYAEASGIKPAETYPKSKIAEIDGIFAAEVARKKKELDDQYAGLIAGADKLFAAKTWEEARKGYTDALSLKPGQQYPQEQIGKIDIQLGEVAKQKAIAEQYAGLIAAADQLFAEKKYDEAKPKYSEASGIKPAETYPKTRIAEIDGILAAIAKQKQIEGQYAAAITEADNLFAAKTYGEAKAKYQAASAIKPDEQYPKTKISEIDGILASEATRMKNIEDIYNAAMANAARLLAEKAYELSKAEYLKASGIKPGEQLPKDKIIEIDGILAEIAAKKAVDDKYSGLITAADRLFAEKKYDESKTSYSEALVVKPAETYPKTKIAEIDNILAAIAAQKVIEGQYAAAIAEADNLFGVKSYGEAKAKYQAASAIKPDEQYPKTKIAEIDAIFAAEASRLKDVEVRYNAAMANAARLLTEKAYETSKAEYLKASGIKPEEQLPKDKIAEIDAILAELAAKKALDEQYAGIITNADQLFGQKNYEESKTKYTEALALKPAEAYPKTKIAEIDGMFARQKALEDQYAGIIAKADQLFGAKSYPEAKAEYQNALKIKAAEQYPKDRIGEIDAALAEIARQKTIGDQYKAQVTKADQLFTAKQYEQALTEYTAALAIKAGEQYPKDRIAEIQGILAELKAKEDAYRASVKNADQFFAEKKYVEARVEYQNAGAVKPLEQYPKDRISEISRILTEMQGKKVTYDNLLQSAGDLLGVKEYNKSKELYQQASGIFPEEAFPRDRIAYITRTVDSIYRANKGQYDIAVANGDKYYTAFEFDKAIDAYTEATGYLPMESYPKEQIAKIRRTIAENAIVDVLRTPVTIAAGDEKKFSFEPVNIAARKDNFVYLKIRNLSDKSFNILMRYGRDAQSNGGVVIRNISTDGKVNERLISVRDQDLWYRADNNWISLFPQGGDIEVSFIQVSKVR